MPRTRRSRCRGCSTGSNGGGCCASRDGRWPASIGSWPCPRPTSRPSGGSTATRGWRRSTWSRPASTPASSPRRPRRSCAPKHLAFVGSMDWMPNEDAVLFFCREVLPRVRAERARRDAVDCRPGADAGGEAAGAGSRHRRHRHRRRRPHLPRAGVRDDRAPPRRRRHAPEDLRGHGRRQGGDLDHHRRRRAAHRIGPAPPDRGRRRGVRRCRPARRARARAAPAARARGAHARHPALRLVRGRGPARTQSDRCRRRERRDRTGFHPRRGRRTSHATTRMS